MSAGSYSREDRLEMITQDYHTDATGKTPRYYQANAINRTIDAIANGQNRVLLVMATGTGKTYVAFQVIWRLWKSRRKKRILFLADRNILVDQTRNNDFKPYGSAMTKITNRTADKSYEVYLALYQAVTGTEDFQNIYKEFSQDFFDLIVVDECHRASAASAAFAPSMARSGSRVTMAFTLGLTRSIWARWASITSTQETSFSRMRRASSRAVKKHSSETVIRVRVPVML